MSQFSRDEIERLARSEIWFHSINLGHGIVTKGQKTAAALAKELEALHLPDLRGKTVLDIGTFDGFYAFEAERRGAKRVVAIDHYVWEYERRWTPTYLDECRLKGIDPEPPYRTDCVCWEWRPEELPGKRRFDIAHRALDSKVEVLVADFMRLEPSEIGTFDVVLFLGVLYHMKNPLEALRRVALMTQKIAIIETEAVGLAGYEDHALCEFFEADELNGDSSNWWAPNERAIHGLCRAAGFRQVETVQSLPKEALLDTKSQIIRYRAIVHAWK